MAKMEFSKTLRRMLPGQLVAFPINRESRVRVTCNRLYVETGARYKCSRQMDKRVVCVMRIRRPRKALHKVISSVGHETNDIIF